MNTIKKFNKPAKEGAQKGTKYMNEQHEHDFHTSVVLTQLFCPVHLVRCQSSFLATVKRVKRHLNKDQLMECNLIKDAGS